MIKKRKFKRKSIERNELRLAFFFLLPTISIVLAIIFFPLVANFWISLKPIFLSDLRAPTVLVNERARGDLEQLNGEVRLEYRIRNSSQKEPISEVQIRDVIPFGLVDVRLEKPVPGCNVISTLKAGSPNLYIFSCRWPELAEGESERIRLQAKVTQDYLDNPVNPKDSLATIEGKSNNKLTSLNFTLENYTQIIDSEEFYKVLKTTFLYTFGGTLGALVLGLMSALLLNSSFFLRGVVRGLLLFPYVAPVIAVAFTWVIMFDPFSGIVNNFLIETGIIANPINFFGQRIMELDLLGIKVEIPLALTSVILFEAWRYFPLAFLFILARMQSFQKEIQEAAIMDGATPLQSFWFISLPQLMGIFFILFLLRFIWTFNKFDDIFLLTGGGAGTRTLTVDVYEQGFAVSNLGVGAAVAVIIFLILLVFSTLFLKFSPEDR